MPFERFEEEHEEVHSRPFDRAMFLRMLRYLLPYRARLRWLALVILGASAVHMFQPYLLGRAIDHGVIARDLREIDRIAIALLALHLIAWVSNGLRIALVNEVGQSVLYDLRQELFEHIQRLSLRFYDERPVGRIMSRITSDVNAIADLVNTGLVTILTQGVTLLGTLVVMVWLSWQLSLLSFVTLPLLGWFYFTVRPRIETGWRNVRRSISNISANLNESINGIYVTQAFAREARNRRTFGRLTTASHDAWLATIRVEETLWPAVDLVGVGSTAVILVVGAWLVFRDSVTIGLILAFSTYLWSFWAPVSAMSKVYGQALSAMASAERIFEFLDTEPEVADRPGARELPLIAGRVTFDRVDFRYEPTQPLVLEGIELDVSPGETIALVGPTGSGKSSIVNLILRFYDPVRGAVRIDGQDLRDVTLASVREQMAIVLQESYLFSGTIEENIRYGNERASEAELRAVVEAVHLAPFVDELEEGLGYDVGERGARLSVGQRQLVAFARALLADPRILILDEATSNIDSETERVIQRAMARLLQGRTAFIIAHRLSTIRHADRILVIEDGRIIEQGRHDELLALGGRYADLHATQFAGARVVQPA